MVISGSSKVTVHVVTKETLFWTIIFTVSVTAVFVPSLTLSVNVMIVSTSTVGAVNEAERASLLVMITPCTSEVHLYVRESSVSVSVAVPESVTVSPSCTV